jgi:hypothetical protein
MVGTGNGRAANPLNLLTDLFCEKQEFERKKLRDLRIYKIMGVSLV